ncbi:hypothetical protein [Actinopolymorpha rutila]|uniref:Uncharacterized protein n=1 Tax=Actinopolymorpha rutila TaxID=446787 RepID=A0A852Z7H4_9ACTN|nr:hypothetical protein [Actinopolymorpha rutila]NYH89227.1 hypothetical protein [Actinopolymorpha rutila]
MGLAGATTSAGDRAIFEPVTPTRILDTRTGDGGTTGKVGPAQTITLQVSGRGGVASDAVAVVLTLTATGSTADSYLTVWPAGQTRPATSTSNFQAGTTTATQATVKLGTGGKVQIYNHAGSVHVIADVAGYYRGHTHDDAYYTKSQNDARDIQEDQLVGGWIPATQATFIPGARYLAGADVLATGSYAVHFTRSVGNCTFTATLAGNTDPGTVIVNGTRSGFPKDILVSTFDTSGTPAPRSFNIVGICGPPTP